jgi:hypothetical protein
MELGNVVWFASRERPFVVRERHCLDLECSCTDAWLMFTEVDLNGKSLKAPLTFEVRINLRLGRERRPPKRAPEVQALVREFLVCLPAERFEDMVECRHEQRAIQRRLEEYMIDASTMGELVCYSDVIYEEGGMLRNARRFSFFFNHNGCDYLIEDYYCPRPSCDCRNVQIEFWKRIEAPGRSRRVEVNQHARASITLNGRLEEITLHEEDRRSAETLAQAWVANCPEQLEECRQRYERIKSIGHRSLASHPAVAPTATPIVAPKNRPTASSTAATMRATSNENTDRRLPKPTKSSSPRTRIGRNEPCPCGSGKKFKRCCGRR